MNFAARRPVWPGVYPNDCTGRLRSPPISYPPLIISIPQFNYCSTPMAYPQVQVYSNSNIIATPGSFPHTLGMLHAERSYLLANLQQENSRAAALLMRIALLEEFLIENPLLCNRRKHKKQIRWCKTRLRESNRQEKIILTRLNQLTGEIRLGEEWFQVQNGLSLQEIWHDSQSFHSHIGPYPDTEQQHVQLNTSSSESRASGYFEYSPWSPIFTQWLPIPWPRREQQPDIQLRLPDIPIEPHRSEDISPRDVKRHDHKWVTGYTPSTSSMLPRSASLNNVKSLDVLATNTIHSIMPNVKRHSLPSLFCETGYPNRYVISAKANVENEEDLGSEDRYLGFYVSDLEVKSISQ